MGPKEYEDKIEELRRGKVRMDEYGDEEVWASLDDEYAYKKFVRMWEPVHETVQTVSGPILVEVEEVPYDTGNPFIKAAFFGGGDEDGVFEYDRPAALPAIAEEAFTGLGMAFMGDVSYEKTKREKIWGNSERGGIRYVKAFGGYAFGNEYEHPVIRRGPLANMRKAYEDDREEIREILEKKYLEHFGRADAQGFDFEGLLGNLRAARGALYRVSPKAATADSYRSCGALLAECVEQVEKAFRKDGEKDG